MIKMEIEMGMDMNIFMRLQSILAGHEYVSGTWEECQTMLENGQIDLLTSAQYTKERAEKFDFQRYLWEVVMHDLQ